MTENGTHYVAEQAWTCCSIEVASRLLEVDSPTWLLPFLRLAGGDGEHAGTRVLATPAGSAPWRPTSARTLLEEVELGEEAVLDGEGGVRRSMVWRTAGFTVLFRRLEGQLSATPRERGTILGIEGSFEMPTAAEAVPNGALASRRAAEAAVRSLLGHLRAALEDPGAEEMLA